MWRATNALSKVEVGAELVRLMRLGRGGEAPRRVAGGQADRLRADVEARRAAAARPAAKAAAAVVDHRAECRQPPLDVGADRAPEQGIIVDVVIVAGQDKGAEAGDGAVDEQEALVAARADLAEGRASRWRGRWWGRACRGWRRVARRVARAAQGIGAQQVVALALDAGSPDFDPTQLSSTSAVLAGSRKLCHDSTQPAWSGASQARGRWREGRR